MKQPGFVFLGDRCFEFGLLYLTIVYTPAGGGEGDMIFQTVGCGMWDGNRETGDAAAAAAAAAMQMRVALYGANLGPRK